jgi:hypothetical protein
MIATETAATGAATTAVGAPSTVLGMPTTAPGIGADRIASSTTAGAAMTDMGAATSAANGAGTAWHFGRGVVHIVQYFPSLLEEAHAPHSQLEAEEEVAMMGGLLMLVVVAGAVCAGSVCAACPCCFVRLTCINVPKNYQTTAYWGLPESS